MRTLKAVFCNQQTVATHTQLHYYWEGFFFNLKYFGTFYAQIAIFSYFCDVTLGCHLVLAHVFKVIVFWHWIG